MRESSSFPVETICTPNISRYMRAKQEAAPHIWPENFEGKVGEQVFTQKMQGYREYFSKAIEIIKKDFAKRAGSRGLRWSDDCARNRQW